MAVVLKISYQGQMHRVLFPSMPGYADVDSAVKQKVLGSGYVTKYADEEGDLCSLVEPTFADFVTTAKETPSGQQVFHVEVFATLGVSTSCTMQVHVPVASYTRNGARRHQRQPTLKDVWEDDLRDLDELLQQFEDPAQPKKSNNRKKKKRSKKARLEEPSDQNAGADPECVKTETKVAAQEFEDVAATAATNDETAGDTGQQGLDQSACGLQLTPGYVQDVLKELPKGKDACALSEETACDNDIGDCETDGDASWVMHLGEKLDTSEEDPHECEAVAMRAAVPRRSSSCPSLTGCQDSQLGAGEGAGSRIAKAWPFVDPDKVLIDFDRLSSKPTNLVGTPKAEASQETWSASESNLNGFGAWDEALGDFEAMPLSAPPGMSNYPQVVWMPVLINWAAADCISMPPENVAQV